MINVLSFEVRYRNGKREDWVTYAPKHNPTATTSVKVAHITPPDEFTRDNRGLKSTHMRAMWGVVEPAYNAWLKGQEIPEDGIPLQAWSGLNAAQVKELIRHQIRTVEDLGGMTDGQLQKVQLPDLRSLRRQAQMYLDGLAGVDTSRKLADQEVKMEAMREQMEAMQARLSEAQKDDKPKRGPGRPRKAEAEAAAG